MFNATFDLSSLNGKNGFIINNIGAGGEQVILHQLEDINGDGISGYYNLIGAPFSGTAGCSFW